MSKYIKRGTYTCRTCDKEFTVDNDTTVNLTMSDGKGTPVNFCCMRCRVLFKMYTVGIRQYISIATHNDNRQLIDEELQEIGRMITEQKDNGQY